MKQHIERDDSANNFGDVCCDNGGFCDEPHSVIEPTREVCSTILGEVQASDGAKFCAKSLEEDGDDVRQEDQLEAVGCTGLNIGCVASYE